MTFRRAGAICALIALSAVAAAAQAPQTSIQARLDALGVQLRAIERELASSPSGIDSGASAEMAALVARVEALDQSLKVLERKLEIEREAQAEAAKSAPAVTAGSAGFSFKSGDGNFQVKFRGLVQSDGRFYAGDTANAAVDTFSVRRVRPILEATLFKRFDVKVMPDFGDGRTVLQDAYVDLRFAPSFVVRAGKYKSPFGLDRLVSASELLFLERALPTTVAPNRDVGLMVHGDVLKTRLYYSVGVFDGALDGSSTDLDDRDGKDITGRVFVHPFRGTKRERLEGLGVGVAASHGQQDGTVTAANLASYRTTGQTYFRYRADGTATGTAYADGTRYRYSAQGYYYSGRLGILGEQVFSSQHVRRGAAVADVGVNAWLMEGSWVLTGEKASYRAVTPAHAFEPGKGAWGAFELAGRITALNVGDEAFPIFADPRTQSRTARAWTAGVNWYLNRGVKVVLNYEQVHFDGGAGDANRAVERGVFNRIQFSF